MGVGKCFFERVALITGAGSTMCLQSSMKSSTDRSSLRRIAAGIILISENTRPDSSSTV